MNCPHRQGMTRTREQRIYRTTILGSIVNVILLAGKFAAGILGHSAAMIADAVHSLSDFLTDIVVIVLVRFSSKPADNNHPYGHGKYETMATSIIGITLAAVGILLGWNGIVKIIHFMQGAPQQSPETIALIAAIASIVLKEWVFRATKKVAVEVHSPTLEANAWHHRSDALSSIGTALGIGGALLLGGRWAVLDAVAAVVVSGMIIITALRLLRQASGELLEESLPKQIEDTIIQIAYRDPLVRDVHHLHTRRIGSIMAIELHLRLPGEITLEESHAHATRIERALKDEFGEQTHIMLHVEPLKNENAPPAS